MKECENCGIPFHQELERCPLCSALRSREAQRRRKLWYLTNTLAVSFVAIVVGVRAIAAPDVQLGMTAEDCQTALDLSVETRQAIVDLSFDESRAKQELSRIAQSWKELSQGYVPGKFSWSSSGREFDWLNRLALSADAIASGTQVKLEGDLTEDEYLVELTRLHPRYCRS